MKLFFKRTLFCLSALILLVSCSSDDNGGEEMQQGAEFVGTWVLTQITLSEPIDTNDDGATSSNLLDEVDCLRETLTLNPTFEWASTEVFASLITPITGNLYNVTCSDERSENGNWGVSGSNLFLIGSVNRTFLISGDQLIENFGQDLPGIRTKVYSRQ